MIGTVFASPRGEINEMKIHIGRLTRTTLLRSTPCGERMHLRKREAYHGKANFRISSGTALNRCSPTRRCRSPKSLALAGAPEHAAQIAEQFAAARGAGGRRCRPAVMPVYSKRHVAGDSMIRAQIAA
jgi:hypothetical protein